MGLEELSERAKEADGSNGLEHEESDVVEEEVGMGSLGWGLN